MKAAPYQLLGRLRPDEYAALEADIEKRGVLVAVEVDENGEILDGHHRVEIADRLGKPYKTIVRKFKTEAEKREHVIKLNLCRRHLDAIRWGLAFRALCDERGARRGEGGDRKSPATVAVDTVAELAKEVGVPERTARHRVAQAEAYEALPKKTQKQIDEGEITLPEARRLQRKAEIPDRVAEIPDGKYRVFYADPPWRCRDSRAGLDAKGYGRAERHYDSMTIGELCEMPIKDRAHDDAVLFLWVTLPKLDECWPVIPAWGFKYKTAIIWDKVKHNFGHYLSACAELLLVCTRGSCTPDIDKKIDNVVVIPKSGKHSEKPERFREIIDELYPHGSRIELFARKRVKGWDCWGNEVG